MEDLYESSHLYACTSQKYIMTNDGSIVEYEMIKNLVNTLPREVKGPTCKAKHFLTAHTHALPLLSSFFYISNMDLSKGLFVDLILRRFYM